MYDYRASVSFAVTAKSVYHGTMKPFLILDETIIDKTLAPASRDDYTTREAARGIVYDDAGAVALLFVARDGYYKLPGGGIDPGESPEIAFARELKEEIGCTAEITHELGTLLEQRYYWNMTQLSYCYVARQTGEKGKPDFTESERERGFEVVWANDIDEAIRLLESSEDITPKDDLEQNIIFMRHRDVAIAKKAKEVTLSRQ